MIDVPDPKKNLRSMKLTDAIKPIEVPNPMRNLRALTDAIKPIEFPDTLKAYRPLFDQLQNNLKPIAAYQAILKTAFPQSEIMKAAVAITEATRRMAEVMRTPAVVTFAQQSLFAAQAIHQNIIPVAFAFRDTLGPLIETIERNQKAYEALGQQPLFRLAQELSRIVPNAPQVQAPPGLYEEPADFEDEALESHVGAILDELLAGIQRATQKVELRAVRDFLYMLVPLILSLWYARYLDRGTSEKLEEIERKFDQRFDGISGDISDLSGAISVLKGRDSALAAKLEKLQATLDERLEGSGDTHIYVVERGVAMTVEKKFAGSPVALLSPGQEVEIIVRDHKWVRVATYDPFSRAILEGWVKKKYLRRFDR